MVKFKKQPKVKEPVHIRFKELRNGNKSIYLDLYRDGKRSYEFLKLYLIPESSATAKQQNREILKMANTMKARRIIELSNSIDGITANSLKSKMILRDWLQIYLEQERKKYTSGTVNNVRSTISLLSRYGDDILLRDIDKEYCIGFVDFLKTTPKWGGKIRQGNKSKSKTGNLSVASINHYFEIFSAALNFAVRQDVLSSNPAKKLDRSEKPHRPESTRTFLTIDEVRKMIETPAKRQDVKNAFLFSCFCGLRWSDICRLTWGNIEENNGNYSAYIVMQKTREPLYLPLSHQAFSFLPKREKAGRMQPIFKTLKHLSVANRILKQWAIDAGIEKHISFHVARHTFATTSLTLGADLYTTSKLLGHTNISITQVYARIINQKKNEAVALFDSAFK